MSKKQDIEDLEPDEQEEETFVLTNEQVSQTLPQLRREGYYFSETGLKRLAKEISSSSIQDVCDHFLSFSRIYYFIALLPEYSV